MIDHGNSLSDNQLYTAKAIAKHILLSLSDNDKVSETNTAQSRATRSVRQVVLSTLHKTKARDCWVDARVSLQVSVIGLSATVSYPRVDRCLRQHLVPFTAEANMQFLRFIEQLQKQTSESPEY